MSGSLKTGRVMVKDEDVCLHCGMCAERCPTGAWDMQKFPFEMPQAGACNADRERKRFRRPVRQRQRLGFGHRQPAVRPCGHAHGRAGGDAQHLPVQHSGLADLVRGPRHGEGRPLGARGGTDLMVAMNPQTWDKDVASIEPGGYLFYDCSRPIPASKFREDMTVIGVPLPRSAIAHMRDPRQRQLLKNIMYLGALSAAARHGRRRDRSAASASSSRARTS